MDRNTADTDPESTEMPTDSSDVRFDNWPVEGYDDPDAVGPAFIGLHGAASSDLVFYAEGEDVLFEADVDEANRRIVPISGTERELGPDETIGDALADLGDRLDWESLSSFAREHLETTSDEEFENVADPVDEDVTGAADTAVASPERSTFTRSNVAEHADHDIEFSASVTYRATDDRVFIVNRTFEATLDGSPAEITVTERVLRAEEPESDRREGPADPIREGTTSFTIEPATEADVANLEAHVERQCEEWHEAHVEPVV